MSGRSRLRILIGSKRPVPVVHYRRRECRLSDHKPVVQPQRPPRLLIARTGSAASCRIRRRIFSLSLTLANPESLAATTYVRYVVLRILCAVLCAHNWAKRKIRNRKLKTPPACYIGDSRVASGPRVLFRLAGSDAERPQQIRLLHIRLFD